MDSELSKQSLWVPRRASTASPIESPTSPTSGAQVQPSVPEHTENDDEPSPLSPSDPTSGEPQQRQRRDSRVKNTGRRIAQIVKLKPEFVEQYKEYHANVWPEVLKQIKECQIRDCETPPPSMLAEQTLMRCRFDIPRSRNWNPLRFIPVCRLWVR